MHEGSGKVIKSFYPRMSENCVLTALAAFEYYKEHPNIEPADLERKIIQNPKNFWQNKINIGSL